MAALRSALDLLEAGPNCTHEDIATCPNYRAHLAELVEAAPLPGEVAKGRERVVRLVRSGRRSPTCGA